MTRAAKQSAGEKQMAKYYHGSKTGRVPSGRVFFAASQEYAAGYGRVREVEINEASLRVLDLSSIRSGEDVAYDFSGALEIMREQGLDTDGLVDLGDEGHGLVRQIVEKVAIEHKFDAIKIHEWTLYVGDTISLCVFDFCGVPV